MRQVEHQQATNYLFCVSEVRPAAYASKFNLASEASQIYTPQWFQPTFTSDICQNRQNFFQANIDIWTWPWPKQILKKYAYIQEFYGLLS